VDLLTRFFPQHMDRLEREKAHFPGDGPLLLSSLTTDDLAILHAAAFRQSRPAAAVRLRARGLAGGPRELRNPTVL